MNVAPNRVLALLVLRYQGCDHLCERVVSAVFRGSDVHDSGLNVLLLEASVHEMKYLGLLDK